MNDGVRWWITRGHADRLFFLWVGTQSPYPTRTIWMFHDNCECVAELSREAIIALGIDPDMRGPSAIVEVKLVKVDA